MTGTDELALLNDFLLVGALLFGIGLVGFVTRRNMIVVFLSVEIMLQGVALSLVGWSRYHDDWGGQILVLFMIAVAGCEAAIALALILMLVRQAGTLDLVSWQDLREEGIGPYVDVRVPEDPVRAVRWPELTPAGVRPEPDDDQLLYRERV